MARTILLANVRALAVQADLYPVGDASHQAAGARVAVASFYHTPFELGEVVGGCFDLAQSRLCPPPFVFLEGVFKEAVDRSKAKREGREIRRNVNKFECTYEA